MGVQSSADRIIQNIENAFAAISDKGGTVPASKVSGNLVSAINSIPGGAELPELSNPGTADDLISGKELIGQNGEKITGNVQMVPSGNTGLIASTSDVSFVKNNYSDYINMRFLFPDRIAFDAQSSLNVQCNAVNFGDATEADVTAGKTFTSASGLRKVGTKANTGGGGEVTPPTPDDGKTRVYIHLEYGRTSPMMGVCPNGTVTVDWGDGTEQDILTGTRTTTVKWTPTHNYAEPGDYVISLTVDGEFGFYGSSIDYSGILRYSNGTDTRNRTYQNAVRKVEIGVGVTSIGNNAFYNCGSLTSITIPDSVTSIGNNAFYNCYSLTSITIPDRVTSIGTYAFYNCGSLTSITIPDSVTSIGNNAFYNCYSLTSITIPDRVTSIGTYAFCYCNALQNITIHDGVTSIGNNAFQYCYSIASVTIPDSVTSIGNNAFYSCAGVRYYDFTACTSVPALSGTYAFNYIVSDCEMLIPAALYDEWSTATNWATYANYMVAV